MKAENVTFNAAGDKLLIGAHFHELTDHTTSTVAADTLADFVEVADGFLSSDTRLILNGNTAKLNRKVINRYSKPLVTCVLQDTPVLKRLVEMNGKAIPLSSFAAFMDEMKRFTDYTGLELLASMRHFRIQKLLEVESKDDRKGNVSHSFKLEKSGNDDFTPPDSVKFTVPVFKHHPDTVTHSFELFMDVKSRESAPEVTFTLKSFEFSETIEARKREIMTAGVAGLLHEKIWGEQEVHVQDDAWSFKANPDNPTVR